MARASRAAHQPNSAFSHAAPWALSTTLLFLVAPAHRPRPSFAAPTSAPPQLSLAPRGATSPTPTVVRDGANALQITHANGQVVRWRAPEGRPLSNAVRWEFGTVTDEHVSELVLVVRAPDHAWVVRARDGLTILHHAIGTDEDGEFAHILELRANGIVSALVRHGRPRCDGSPAYLQRTWWSPRHGIQAGAPPEPRPVTALVGVPQSNTSTANAPPVVARLLPWSEISFAARVADARFAEVPATMGAGRADWPHAAARTVVGAWVTARAHLDTPATHLAIRPPEPHKGARTPAARMPRQLRVLTENGEYAIAVPTGNQAMLFALPRPASCLTVVIADPPNDDVLAFGDIAALTDADLQGPHAVAALAAAAIARETRTQNALAVLEKLPTALVGAALAAQIRAQPVGRTNGTLQLWLALMQHAPDAARALALAQLQQPATQHQLPQPALLTVLAMAADYATLASLALDPKAPSATRLATTRLLAHALGRVSNTAAVTQGGDDAQEGRALALPASLPRASRATAEQIGAQIAAQLDGSGTWALRARLIDLAALAPLPDLMASVGPQRPAQHAPTSQTPRLPLAEAQEAERWAAIAVHLQSFRNETPQTGHQLAEDGADMALRTAAFAQARNRLTTAQTPALRIRLARVLALSPQPFMDWPRLAEPADAAAAEEFITWLPQTSLAALGTQALADPRPGVRVAMLERMEQPVPPGARSVSSPTTFAVDAADVTAAAVQLAQRDSWPHVRAAALRLVATQCPSAGPSVIARLMQQGPTLDLQLAAIHAATRCPPPDLARVLTALWRAQAQPTQVRLAALTAAASTPTTAPALRHDVQRWRAMLLEAEAALPYYALGLRALAAIAARPPNSAPGEPAETARSAVAARATTRTLLLQHLADAPSAEAAAAAIAAIAELGDNCTTAIQATLQKLAMSRETEVATAARVALQPCQSGR